MEKIIKYKVIREDAKFVVATEWLSDRVWVHNVENNVVAWGLEKAPVYDGTFNEREFGWKHGLLRVPLVRVLDNGQELYEGDIIKSPDEDMDYCLCEWNEKISCYQINGYGKAMYRNEGSGEEYSNEASMIEENILVLGTDYIEVIGSIHLNTQNLPTK